MMQSKKEKESLKQQFGELLMIFLMDYSIFIKIIFFIEMLNQQIFLGHKKDLKLEIWMYQKLLKMDL